MASLADMVRQNKMQSIPQDKLLGGLSSGLGAVRNFGNKVNVPYFGGMGNMFLGKSPEEIENWSYGNSPFQSTEMGLPQIKRERKQSLVDALSALTPMASMTKGLPVGMSIKDISKNLNSDLLQKYLTTGKRTPKEIAQYEANGLAMETPQLQRYNVANAKAQIPNDAERMGSLGMNTSSYHVSRNNEDILKFRNRINDTSLFNGLGTHSGTQEAATQRAKDTLGFNRDTGRKNPEMSSYYPLQLRANKSFELNGKPVDEYGAELYLDNLGRPLGMGRESDVGKEAIQDAYFKNNDVLKYINDVEDKGSISYISPPKNIRSRFAAFDPLRKNSSSLLASLLGGTALVGQYNKEKKMKEMR